jgi:predicted GNAT family N-acyltransferase
VKLSVGVPKLAAENGLWADLRGICGKSPNNSMQQLAPRATADAKRYSFPMNLRPIQFNYTDSQASLNLRQ